MSTNNNIVIKVDNPSKVYRLGEVGTGTISHDLNRWFAIIRGKEDPFSTVGSVNDRTQTTRKWSTESNVTQRSTYFFGLIEARTLRPLKILGKRKLRRRYLYFKILFERSEFILSVGDRLNFLPKFLQALISLLTFFIKEESKGPAGLRRKEVINEL